MFEKRRATVLGNPRKRKAAFDALSQDQKVPNVQFLIRAVAIALGASPS